MMLRSSWILAVIWLVCSLVQASYPTCPDPASYPKLLDATTEELAYGLDHGQFTSVDLAYIARIKEVNSTLRAVVEINPAALSIAAQLDADRAKGNLKGPLHGLPYLIKNNIATKDKMSNTAGSYALLGAKVPRDSTIASKLRSAGVIILGKANLSQWANYRSNNSTSGWSAYGGQTIGAYYPNQDPSGSSSGSAVGSSIGLAVAALGTETDGSILSPSSMNNNVGIKPTVGLTSRSLVIPISEHQDTVGPIARTVKDAAYLLQAIAGKDPNDNYTSAIPFQTLPDYVAACKTGSLKGVRIGIPRNLIIPGADSDVVLAAFTQAIATIRKAGATVIDNTNVTAFAEQEYLNGTTIGKVLNADFLSDLPKNYLSKLVTNPNKISDVATLRTFTRHFPLEDYPDRDTGVWDAALKQGFGNTDPRFWPLYLRNVEVGGIQGVLGVLKNHSLDALLLPTDFSPDLPSRVGSPVVTVPMGFYPTNQKVERGARGLVEVAPNVPFGLSFLGPRWSEARLISYAYDYEQRTHTRNKVQPHTVPKTELKDVVQCGKGSSSDRMMNRQAV